MWGSKPPRLSQSDYSLDELICRMQIFERQARQHDTTAFLAASNLDELFSDYCDLATVPGKEEKEN